MAKQVIKTKAQIIAAIAEKADITKVQAKTALESLLQIAYEGAKKDKDGFTVPGLGKLYIASRKARVGRNPRTNETMKFPAKKVAKFKLCKAAKDAVVPPKT